MGALSPSKDCQTAAGFRNSVQSVDVEFLGLVLSVYNYRCRSHYLCIPAEVRNCVPAIKALPDHTSSILFINYGPELARGRFTASRVKEWSPALQSTASVWSRYPWSAGHFYSNSLSRRQVFDNALLRCSVIDPSYSC